MIHLDSTTTILDPCGGRGIFLIELIKYARSKGLDLDTKNLYYNDINPAMTAFFRKINKAYKYGIPDENITCADALTKEWNMRFSAMVGNPPFQKTFDGERKAKKYNLWSEFIRKGMTMTDNILFVCPDGWMSTNTDIYDEMREFGIKHANIEDCGQSFPGVGVRFTYFNLVKDYTGPATVTYHNQTTTVDYNNLPMICPDPDDWGILQKVTRGSEKMGWSRGSGYHTSDRQYFNDTGQHTVFHTNAQEFKTDHIRGDQSRSKVITTISGYFIPKYDPGLLGVTQATAVIITDQLAEFQALLETKLYQYVINKIARQQGWINLSLLKELALPPLKTSYTDTELFDYFDLTEQERAIILTAKTNNQIDK